MASATTIYSRNASLVLLTMKMNEFPLLYMCLDREFQNAKRVCFMVSRAWTLIWAFFFFSFWL